MRSVLTALAVAALAIECALATTGLASAVLPRAAALACGAAVLIAAVLPLRALWRHRRPAGTRDPQPWHVAGFATACAVGCSCTWRAYSISPWGWWDAWCTWNARARHLYLAQGNWFEMLTRPEASWHSDYPPFLPLSVVGGWQAAGRMSDAVPIALSLTAYLGLCAGFYACLLRLEWLGRGPATAFAVLLSLTPEMVHGAARQCADIPLAFACFLAFMLLRTGLWDDSRVHRIVAGLALSVAACTKNEGAVLAAIIVGVVAWEARRRRVRTLSISALTDVAIGAVPLVVALAAFKLYCAPANDLFKHRTLADVAAAVSDLSRHRFVLKAMVMEYGEKGHWGDVGYCIAAVLGYRLLSSRRLSVGPAGIVAFASVLAYYAIYIITPHDLAWHVRASLNRVFSQTFAFLLLWVVMQLAPASGATAAGTGDGTG
jgi:hypothetical protein